MARRGTIWVLAILLGTFCASPCAGQVASGNDEGGEWRRLADFAPEDFISHIITAIDVDKDGKVWVGSDRGLVWTPDSGRTWNAVNLAFATLREPDADADTYSGRELTGAALQRRNAITCIESGWTGVWVGTLNGLCFKPDERQGWTLFTASFNSPGPEIWAVEEHGGEVWVAATNGLFKTDNSGSRWGRITGAFPRPVRSILISESNGKRSYWLAGFDSPPSYRGGADVLRSEDGGATWESLKTDTASPISKVLSTRAHKLFIHDDRIWAATRHGLAYSEDGGHDWRRIRPQSGFDAEEAFDIAFQQGRLWVATSEGFYTSADNGKTWVQTGHLRCPITTLRRESNVLWAGTGEGLIRRIRGGDLKSFSVRSNVLCLARTTESWGEIWWAGTTGGLLYSRDMGRSWRSMTVADGLPSNLVLSLAANGNRLWAGTDGGIWTCADGLSSSRQYGREHGLRGMRINDMTFDGTTVWAATDKGLSRFVPDEQEWRTYQANKQWHAVCMNENTIFGAVSDAARPADMSLIFGKTEPEEWDILDVPGLNGARIHQLLRLGADVWLAADSGLFRTRDGGVAWARFGTETLRSSRVTAMCGAGTNVLCVQAVPNDPPSATAYLNVTRDSGRTWSVLREAIPGHASALMEADDGIVAGVAESRFADVVLRGGLSMYREFAGDLQPGRSGWLKWMQIAGYAASTYRPDRLGEVSVIDEYALHAPTVWWGSSGAGVLEKGPAPLENRTRSWDATGTVPLDVRGFSLLDGKRVTSAGISEDGQWFGTRDGLYFRDRLGHVQVFRPTIEGLIAAPIWSVAAANGLIYAGTDYGLSVYDRRDGQWRTYQKGASPLPDNRVLSLAYDGETLWGGTADSAFRIGVDGSWKTMLMEEGIPDIALGSVREYFASGRGVFALDREGTTRRHLQVRNSPLTDDDVKRVFIDVPELWAATARGIARILYDRAEPPARRSTEPARRGPDGVLIVINENSEDSIKVGEAYRALRNVPEKNVCRIRCSTEEVIGRGEYEEQIRAPVLRQLLDRGLGRVVSFIVTTSGVPLTIAAGTAADAAETDQSAASVDSELALVGLSYPPNGPVPNPYLHRDELFDSTRLHFYLVTRLDGPDPDEVISRVKDGLAVERDQAFGSRGFARFDLHPDETPLAARLNRAIQYCYRTMRRQERFMGRIELPENTILPFFRKDSAINTFFFVGWQEREYDPEVFSWVQGAVAVTLDPVTAATLKDPKKSWVAAATQAGVVGSIGNVSDPGPAGRPSIAGLFEYIRSGYTWAEAAYMCIPYLSWQTVVVGDPLYAPYR
jgi:uncharacterized protein (TIGR03790 family)